VVTDRTGVARLMFSFCSCDLTAHQQVPQRSREFAHAATRHDGSQPTLQRSRSIGAAVHRRERPSARKAPAED
jgi:hypothetical protein